MYVHHNVGNQERKACLDDWSKVQQLLSTWVEHNQPPCYQRNNLQLLSSKCGKHLARWTNLFKLSWHWSNFQATTTRNCSTYTRSVQWKMVEVLWRRKIITLQARFKVHSCEGTCFWDVDATNNISRSYDMLAR
jgi:hypothetical protein